MKSFIIKNWYKLLIGISVFMASLGFMINSINPAYSLTNEKYLDVRTSIIPTENKGIVIQEYAYFVDGGYIYRWDTRWPYNWGSSWQKQKLP